MNPARWGWWRWRDILQDDGSLYLRRLYLFWCPWFNVCLHWFYQPDAQDLHDHPKGFVSFVLRGSYDEEEADYSLTGTEVGWDYAAHRLRSGVGLPLIESNRRSRRIRWVNFRLNPYRPHRVAKVYGRCLSLVFFGPNVRSGEWGFWKKVSGGFVWVDWKEYCAGGREVS